MICRTSEYGTFYLCHNSAESYDEQKLTIARFDQYGKIVYKYHFRHKCVNDNQSYHAEACGEVDGSRSI